jgi:hypothetical protein
MRRGAYLLPPHQAPGVALPLYTYYIQQPSASDLGLACGAVNAIDQESHFTTLSRTCLTPTPTMDESQPLLSQPLLRRMSEARPPTVNDPEVDFDPIYDPDNPLDGGKDYKMAVVALLALMAGTVYDEQENNPLVFTALT